MVRSVASSTFGFLTVMSKPPWSIPAAHKRKTGDPAENTIYLAVGRALTKWEGLEAEIASLFAVLTGGADRWYFVPSVRAFGVSKSSIVRADMIERAAEAFFLYFDSKGLHNETMVFETELKALMKAYTGWVARRNDIAHGYVTATGHPDYLAEKQLFITTYLLLPSHSSLKWPIDWDPDPAFKYRGSDIDKFAAEFEALDKAVSAYSHRLDQWRKETLAKFPQ